MLYAVKLIYSGSIMPSHLGKKIKSEISMSTEKATITPPERQYVLVPNSHDISRFLIIRPILEMHSSSTKKY